MLGGSTEMASPTPFIPLAPDTFSGRKLGKYEIVCRLSTGGMSEIFLAFQRGVGGFRKYVVLKQILPDIKGEEEFVRMFLDEAKITAAFNHPNIAHVFDLDIADGELFLAMEFVPGATLVEVARMCRINGEPIPIGMTLQAVRDTALALHYAHTFTDPLGTPQPVIHRDIAEKNVMVTYEGTTKLLDFGIAKSQANAGRTMVGMVKGTSGYMSPEQILGEKLDGRSDIFSLGVVLHECLTGMRLFHAKTPEQGMLAPLRETVTAPSKQNPAITPEIDAVVLKSLARTKEQRHATALELARDLEAAAKDLIWKPEQTAPFIQRLFADRREQTRQLLSSLSTQATAELTGEIRLNQFLRGESGPQSQPAPLLRNPPTPRPLVVTADESTDPGGRDRNLVPIPTPRRMSNPAMPATPKRQRAVTEEVTDPRTPPRATKSGRTDNEFTQPLINARPPPPDEVTQGTGRLNDDDDDDPEVRTQINRPEDLAKAIDPSVMQRKTGPRPAPPVPDRDGDDEPQERTVEVRAFAARSAPKWDRDEDDEEAGEELRTQVQPPLPAPRRTTKPVTRTGEHDTVSAVAPPGSATRRFLFIGATLGLAVVGVVGYLKFGGQVTPATSAEMKPVVEQQEPSLEPKPLPRPQQELGLEPVDAAKADAGALAVAAPAANDTKKEDPPPPEEKKGPVAEVKKEEPPPEAAPEKKVVQKVRQPVVQKPPADKVVVAAADPKATGQLTLVTTPWAKVQWKSQDLGVTPLFKVPMPVGKHTLRLIGPDNQVVMLPVEIREGVVTTMRQKLGDITQ